MIKNILSLCLFLTVFVGCSSNSNTAGGAEDVNTFTVAGVILDTGGIEIEGCSVVLLPVDYVPNGSELDSAELTDIDGQYRITADIDVDYNLWAIKDSLSVIVFNLNSDSGNVNRLDTVRVAGSIKVTLPDDYNENDLIEIYIQGTGIYKEVTEEDLINDNGIISVVVDGFAPESYDDLICVGDVTGDTVLNSSPINILPAQLVDDAYYAEWEELDLPAELYSKKITAMVVGDDGTFYVGTDSSGVFQNKDGVWLKTITDSVSLIGIRDLEILNDTLYMIVDEGIVKLYGNYSKNISKGNVTVGSYVINDITILENGMLFATFNIGIGRYNGTKWSHYASASSNSLANVTAVSGNNVNDLYSVNDFGILKFIPDTGNGKWEYVLTDNLQAKKVVVADSLNVWISSGKGLLSYNGNDLSSYSAIGQVGVNAVSIGIDNTVWSSNSITNEIHGIRNNTSIYTESNSPLLGNLDEIVEIASLDEKTTLFASQSKGILKLSYKKMR